MDRVSNGLGLWSATALVIGYTIAIGIFLTPAELIGALASPALTFGLWLVCGAVVLAGAFTFGELASRYPQPGGPYVYLREGWGTTVAFLYGWQALLVLDPGLAAALAAGLSQYLVVVWPAAIGGERWVAAGAIWMLSLISMAGLTLSARVLNVLTALKVLALAAVVVVAFTIGDGSWSHFGPVKDARAGAPPLGEALALGLVGVFFSFGGFWEASRLAAEMREPNRTLPMALALGVTCVTVAYVATTAAFIYLVPAQRATSAGEFARLAGEAMLGARGPSVLAAIVVLSVAASLMALLMMAPRLYVAMGHDRLFPGALASVHPRSGAPVRATAVLTVLATVYVLIGTFQEIVAFFLCVALAFVALAAAALFVVRRSTPDTDAFRTPGYPLAVALFVLLIVGVVALVAVNRPLQALAGFALVLLGWPVYGLFVSHGVLVTDAPTRGDEGVDT